MPIHFFLLILSILGYIFSPELYNHTYILFLFTIFLVTSYSTFKRTLFHSNFFNFHVLFLISFFFVNFVYPVFLYPDNPFYFSVFKKSFNHDIITKATALALVGSSSYSLGVCIKFKREYKSSNNSTTNFKTLQFLLTNIIYIIFSIIFLYAGFEMLSGKFGSTSKIPPSLLVIFQVSLGLSIILLAYSKTYKGKITDFIWKFNKPILAILLSYILLFIYTGDRGPIIQIVLITIGAFSIFVKPIKLKSLLIVILIGMFVLTFISYARSKSVSTSGKGGIVSFVDRGVKRIKLNSVFDLGMDLIVNNRNLYVGYDYANKNGISYGKNMFYYIFAPIPFLPSLMTNAVYNSNPKELTSARIITNEAKSTYGLGTNIIVDLYMAFGTLGVIFFMFCLGFIVRYFQLKAIYGNNLINIIVYIFLIGFSIYLPRSVILEPFRHIIWTIILYLLLKSFRLFLINMTKAANKKKEKVFSNN